MSFLRALFQRLNDIGLKGLRVVFGLNGTV